MHGLKQCVAKHPDAPRSCRQRLQGSYDQHNTSRAFCQDVWGGDRKGCARLRQVTPGFRHPVSPPSFAVCQIRNASREVRTPILTHYCPHPNSDSLPSTPRAGSWSPAVGCGFGGAEQGEHAGWLHASTPSHSPHPHHVRAAGEPSRRPRAAEQGECAGWLHERGGALLPLRRAEGLLRLPAGRHHVHAASRGGVHAHVQVSGGGAGKRRGGRK
eukprot:365221-Chlamydomonas_euryale.AAC.6